MSYRYYKLIHTFQKRSAYATRGIRSFGDKLDITLSERKFDGSDRVLLFDFLKSLVREAHLPSMSKAQLYLKLPRMLKKSAYGPFAAMRDCSAAEEGGVTCWNEAVQYLLRSSATPQTISDVLNSL